MSTHLCCALDLRSAPVDDTRMAYAILRTSKLKSWGNISGSAAHTYRHKGMAPNADPLRMGKNKVLVGRPGEAVEDIRNRISAITDKPFGRTSECSSHRTTPWRPRMRPEGVYHRSPGDARSSEGRS